MSFSSTPPLSGQRFTERKSIVYLLNIQGSRKKSAPKNIRIEGGFSLVEVTMAIGLMSFCLVAMLGMLPVGMSQERRSTDQLLALQALTAVTGDFKNASSGSTQTPKYHLKLPTTGQPAEIGNLVLDANLKEVTSLNEKQFDIAYRIDPPSSEFSSYRIWLRVYRSARPDVSLAKNADYTESVMLKPAF